MADERRRQTRTPVDVPARYVTSDGLAVPCRLANLSLGGALIRTAEPLAFGVKIQLMRLFAVNKCAGGDHLTEQHGARAI